MALINQAKKEISLKIVYWGTGLGGKTVNIIQLSKLLTGKEPIKLSTEEGRTLFFDFSPIEKELPNGYRIRFSVFTTPGQIIYAGARKLLLEGVDQAEDEAADEADDQPGHSGVTLASMQGGAAGLFAVGARADAVDHRPRGSQRQLEHHHHHHADHDEGPERLRHREQVVQAQPHDGAANKDDHQAQRGEFLRHAATLPKRMRKLVSTSKASRKNRSIPWKT